MLAGDTALAGEGSGGRWQSRLCDGVSGLDAAKSHTSRRLKQSIHATFILPK